MVNLILWRHAEAEVESASGADADRALTKAGQKSAAKMAKWLHQHLPPNVEIYCSPARRCLEIVAALQRQQAREMKVVDFLSATSTAEKMAQYLVNDDCSKTLLVIGHQPHLGQLIANLLGMQTHGCVVKKGAVWWLRQRKVDNGVQTYLYAVQHPQLS